MKPKIILCLALVLSCGLVGWFLAMQFFLNWDEQRRAVFISPAKPVNQIYFYDGGFLDRDLYLYAKINGQKPQFIANLWWSPECLFSDAQWTKDGKMIVCSLNVKAANNKSVMAVAFDFSANKSIVPSWMTKVSFDTRPESEWRKQETSVKEMVAAHGGLGDNRITDDMIRANEQKLWFWQAPP